MSFTADLLPLSLSLGQYDTWEAIGIFPTSMTYKALRREDQLTYVQSRRE